MMRYRKSIRLAKGLRINVSKSGLSLSAGIPGLSITQGSRGTYLNAGIPGTGLYDRKRIDGGSRSITAQHTRNNATREYNEVPITISIDENGKIEHSLEDGSPAPDHIINSLKRTEQYKEKVKELYSKRHEQIEHETNQFLYIYQLTPAIIMREQIITELENLKPMEYIVKTYPNTKPTEENVRFNLTEEAKGKIWSWKLWTIKHLRQAWVNEQFPIVYADEIKRFEKMKSDFEMSELSKKSKLDAQYYQEYLEKKEGLELFNTGPQEWLEKEIEDFLSSITLPVEFYINYDYSEVNHQINIDLDLPEIEDLPTEKSSILASGKVSIKQKTQKELKSDYAICVSGLTYFFAGHLFNLSTSIKSVLISGFTQRIDPKLGDTTDQYVISVKFDREKFSKLKFQNIDPIAALENFNHIFEQNKDGSLRTIEPLE